MSFFHRLWPHGLPSRIGFCAFVFLSTTARGGDSLYLELSAKGDQIDLGLAPVSSDLGPESAELAGRVVKEDLAFTGLFHFIEGGPGGASVKSLGEWARLGADVVHTVEISKSLLGKVQWRGSLRDAIAGRVVLEKSFSLEEGERRIAHLWADEVVRYFTGRAGVAASHIVFVNDATGKKEVCVVDADGGGFRRLTNDRSIALFPKLSPDGKWIVFTSYRDGRPAIHRMRSDGSERVAMCRYEGLNSAAAWMPDGESVVATLSDGRSPNLYRVDLNGRVTQALTQSPAVDTAPTVSPDGLRLAFTSDRPGLPQIYVMDIEGGNLRRAVTGPQADSPHWSPLGHLVVYTQLEKRYFDLWTWEVSTGKTTRLTFGEGDNENASWSPDGQHVVFTSTRGGRPELWVMNAHGGQPRRLGAWPGRSFTPHWGN